MSSGLESLLSSIKSIQFLQQTNATSSKPFSSVVDVPSAVKNLNAIQTKLTYAVPATIQSYQTVAPALIDSIAACSRYEPVQVAVEVSQKAGKCTYINTSPTFIETAAAMSISQPVQSMAACAEKVKLCSYVPKDFSAVASLASFSANIEKWQNNLDSITAIERGFKSLKIYDERLTWINPVFDSIDRAFRSFDCSSQPSYRAGYSFHGISLSALFTRSREIRCELLTSPYESLQDEYQAILAEISHRLMTFRKKGRKILATLRTALWNLIFLPGLRRGLSGSFSRYRQILYRSDNEEDTVDVDLMNRINPLTVVHLYNDHKYQSRCH